MPGNLISCRMAELTIAPICTGRCAISDRAEANPHCEASSIQAWDREVFGRGPCRRPEDPQAARCVVLGGPPVQRSSTVAARVLNDCASINLIVRAVLAQIRPSVTCCEHVNATSASRTALWTDAVSLWSALAVGSALRFDLPLVVKGEHTPQQPSDGPAKPRPLLPRCTMRTICTCHLRGASSTAASVFQLEHH